MIIQNEKGMQQLLVRKFQLGADASADADWKLNTEILTYSRAKGAFAGLTLTGASIRRDARRDAFFYRCRPGCQSPGHCIQLTVVNLKAFGRPGRLTFRAAEGRG